MSAPRTNVEKQKRRHRAPLIGLGLAIVFGGIMFVLYLFNAFEGARVPDDTEAEREVTAPPGSEDVGAVDVVPENGSDASQAGDTDADTTAGD